MFDIHIHIEDKASMKEEFKQINLKLKTIMATIQELSAKVDQLQEALDTEQEQIAEAIATLQTAVDELQALVVAGGTEAERQALSDKLDGVIADLESTIADEPETPTEPEV